MLIGLIFILNADIKSGMNIVKLVTLWSSEVFKLVNEYIRAISLIYHFSNHAHWVSDANVSEKL